MNTGNLGLNFDGFLADCETSSLAAYGQWKNLLARLDERNSRTEARIFLEKICQFLAPKGQEAMASHHCAVLPQPILERDGTEGQLMLIQFPSTFLPEEWSQTFYQGLMRYPETEFAGRHIAELGTGNGWISLAMGRRFFPDKITGGDINPKAIVCSWLNLYLNGLDDQGRENRLDDGRSLLDMVSYQESDLLSCFAGETNQLHHIIGCIPQVLNPEPDKMVSLISESASDEDLQSLSNYYAQQGHLEDEFGLGLVTLAVEQSIPLLKANGKLIFNMGGRPGGAVLERLFERRGLTARRIWQTRVEQAGDTDIDALVAIEQRSRHRFEFFLDPVSEQPVCAQTADALQKAGGAIFHEVGVYEAHLTHPRWVKEIFRVVSNREDRSLLSALDLSSKNSDLQEERLSFLASLAPWISKEKIFRYEHAQGLAEFRQQMVEFLRFYYRVSLQEEALVVAPSRRELMANLFSTLDPHLALVDRGLTGLLPHNLVGNPRVLESPNQTGALLGLLDRLKPTLVITSLRDFENHSPDAFASLVARTREIGCLLVVDFSDQLHLTSNPPYNGIFNYLSREELEDHVVLMAGLIHNRVYQDMGLGMMISNHPQLVSALTEAGELTYSRSALLVQKYYAHLLRQLLFFQTTRTNLIEKKKVTPGSYRLVLPERVSKAFSHPALAGNHLPFDENTVRLDFGENELPMPQFLQDAVLESFLTQPQKREDQPDLADAEIRALLLKRFNFPATWYADIAHGGGVASLFKCLLQLAKQEEKPLLVPAGAYGYFVAAAQFQGVVVEFLKTEKDQNFLVKKNILADALVKHPGAFVYLNGPLVNPTGALYSDQELNELCQVVAEKGGTLILDTVFSGLEFDPICWDLRPGVRALKDSQKGRFVLLGGVSKEFSAGGLRWAYAWSPDNLVMQHLAARKSHRPHGATLYAGARLLREWGVGQGPLAKHLAHQRSQLKKRAQELEAVLTANGWEVLSPKGGLFLVACPAAYIGKKVPDPDNPGQSLVIDGDNISRLLFQKTGLAINNATWTGIPNFCRLVLSVDEDIFHKGLECIACFSAWVNKQ